MINEWLEQIAAMMSGNIWIAPLLSFVAGVLTSFTPCSLSNIPLIVGYVGGVGEKNAKKAFWYSILFAIGTAVTFICLGIIATSAGKLMGTSSQLWYMILGILMVLMALQTWGIIQIIPGIHLLSKSKMRGGTGALIAGILGGLFSSPCSTPVLITILAIVAGEGNLVWGILLMFLYSVGHSILVIVAGTSISFVKKLNEDSRYKRISGIIKILMGMAYICFG